MDALVKNAANPDQVKEAAQKEKFRKEKELDGLSSILSTETGRKYIYSVLEFCGVYSTIFSAETNRIYFNEGQRNVGLKLIADINTACPDLYVKMIEESKKEK